MRKFRKALCIMLAVLFLVSCIAIPGVFSSAKTVDYVIINQVYGRADKTDASISHSFIELYNPTDSTVNLDTYSLQYATYKAKTDVGNEWQKLDLTGYSMPAHTSLLIRCYTEDGLFSRYEIASYDIDWSDCVISNDAFKVVLLDNQELLTVEDPSTVTGVIDFVGAGTSNYGETAPIDGISKQKTARRINFTDTDDNSADFEILDYRSTGIDDATLEAYAPRTSADGTWGEDIQPDIPKEQRLVFSAQGGSYSSSFTLNISTGYTNGIIRYTFDGSDPTASSTQYNNGIFIQNRTSDTNVLSAITNISGGQSSYSAPKTNVFKGTVIKAQVFDEQGNALSDIVTNSYFVGAEYGDLPIISLVTDKANFFDSSTGIYVNGNYENSGSDWERPVHFEMIESDGSQVLSQNMGVRINGGTTRSLAQKALRLYAKKGYDAENPTVEYDLFDGKAKTSDGEIITSFKRFLLRSSGNDNNSTMMRDAMMQQLMHDTNTSTQAYRQSVVFINGEFWGIYNIRERNDDEAMIHEYGIDDADEIGLLSFVLNCNNVPDDYDTTDPNMVADYAAYMEMWNWFNNTSTLSSDADYKKAQTYLDIDNLIDYYIANIYVGNTDWPGNNVDMWRYRGDYTTDSTTPLSGNDGRWRFMLKDTDWGFGLQGGNASTNTVSRLLTTSTQGGGPGGGGPGGIGGGGDSGFNPAWSTLFFRKLATNQEFIDKFINRFCDLMNTNFDSEVVTNLINEMQANISGVMQQHVERWGTINSVSTWNSNVNTMKTFASSRKSSVLSHLQAQSQFGLSSTGTLTLKAESSQGYFTLNGMTMLEGETDSVKGENTWSGTYFQGKTQTISATALEGYSFVKFIVGSTEYTTDTIEVSVSSATTVQAIFEPEELTPLKITEVSISGSTIQASLLEFTITATGGTSEKSYTAYILKDGKLFLKTSLSSKNTVEFSSYQKGEYTVLMYCKDSSGAMASHRSTIIIN